MDETKRDLLKAWLIKAQHDLAAARKLSYAAMFRYPGDFLEPTREQFDEALSAADSVWQFVLSILPAEVHP